jgi:hypothetical protein
LPICNIKPLFTGRAGRVKLTTPLFTGQLPISGFSGTAKKKLFSEAYFSILFLAIGYKFTMRSQLF